VLSPAQAVIAVFGVAAIVLSQDRRLSRRRWSSVFGLCSQPAWFLETIQGEQWGMVFLTVVYTIAWGPRLRDALVRACTEIHPRQPARRRFGRRATRRRGPRRERSVTAFYNEIGPHAAAWLRNLIAAGHIAPGVVDERSIVDLDPAELAGYTQCHFFAGIGVWSYALRLAGWPDDRPVWTGSCPCQPFSAAGKGEGHQDERHLWPAWFRLIGERRPATVFGEQVASADGLAWLDAVCTDVETEGYAIGAADLCAAGVGAPHIRQRLFFVADAARLGHSRVEGGDARPHAHEHHEGPRLVGDTPGTRPQGRGHGWDSRPGREGAAAERTGADGFWSACDWLPCRDGKARAVRPGTFPLAHGAAARVGRLRAYGNAIVPQAAAAFIEASGLI